MTDTFPARAWARHIAPVHELSEDTIYEHLRTCARGIGLESPYPLTYHQVRRLMGGLGHYTIQGTFPALRRPQEPSTYTDKHRWWPKDGWPEK